MKLFLRPVVAVLLLLAPCALPAQTDTAYASDPAFQKALQEARLQEKQHQYSFALDQYKKASKVAGGKCMACLQKIVMIDEGLHDWKPALAAILQEEALASTPIERSLAYAEHANILIGQAGDKPKPEPLKQAHALYQQAIEAYPHNISAQFQDGKVLTMMGDNEHAKLAFADCAKNCSPKDPSRVRAQHFAENPELSLHKMAPAFEVTALDGTRFNPDTMRGRVVLIDFWATWCGPCNAALPELKQIAKKFKDEPLTIISVSWDKDEKAWKEFIGRNEMTWTQYRDADHKLSDRFEVQSIPHYFTIDSDGVLTAEMVGSDSNVESKIKKLIAKAKEAQKLQPQVAQNER
ncbi:redoxin family protein [Granulicella cerasi]|uniref:Redoxin family protein n=1 Tax=Granulicella cerasi TaxID=741063 RepID=A0ABW1Z8G9_9BACT|nr:TlpA disulfide reductase family protein [Granulicella cerasi]